MSLSLLSDIQSANIEKSITSEVCFLEKETLFMVCSSYKEYQLSLGDFLEKYKNKRDKNRETERNSEIQGYRDRGKFGDTGMQR